MNNFIQMRKNSYDSGLQSEQQMSMFVKISTKQLSSAIAQLKQYYNPKLHSLELANYCFRCHKIQLVDAYEQFRAQKHPQLQEQKMSSFYSNSSFVDLKQLGRRFQKQNNQIPGPHMAPVPHNIKQLLNELFTNYGYVPNLQRFLLFYPQYLDKHMMLQNNLFQSDKIDNKIAYFIGLCGAAEVGSVYMMCRFLKKFIRAGGDINWITAAAYPTKLKLLLSLNRILARSVWQINYQIIQSFWESSDGHWNKSQLALCIQILAFSHQNSTIALAMALRAQQLPADNNLLNIQKIIQEKSVYDFRQYQSNEIKETLAMIVSIVKQFEDLSQQLPQQINKNQTYLTQLKQEKQVKENKQIQQTKNKFQKLVSKRDLKKSMRKVENVYSYMKQIGNQLTKQEIYQNINKWVSPLLPPFQITEKRNDKMHLIVQYSDFNFKFNGYPVLHNLTQTVADKIINLIQYSEVMTRQSFGHQKQSTKQFRKSLRYYAQNLCGYRHSEYDFKGNITAFLTMSLKFYIRLLMLSPIHISKQSINQVGYEDDQISCFDQGHLAVLISNTKMKLTLTMAILAFDF